MANTTMTKSEIETARQALIRIADEQNRQYPQYRGHWDAWQLARVTRTVKTKLGQAFAKDEHVIWTSERRDIGEGPEVVYTAYSVTNRCNTIVQKSTLEPLAPRGDDEPRTEQGVEQFMLEALSLAHELASDMDHLDEGDETARQVNVQTFEGAGVHTPTRDRGLVLSFPDDSVYHVTVRRVR